MSLKGVTSNSELIDELRKRCGFGPSILRAAQEDRRPRPQAPFRVSIENEDGAMSLDRYMAR
jgi:hypothetical protein